MFLLISVVFYVFQLWFIVCGQGQCGRPDDNSHSMIVYGDETKVGQWPWQVGLAQYKEKEGKWMIICGGALLQKQWVVTAAHCVTKTGTNVKKTLDILEVLLGKHHRDSSKDDEYVQKRKIESIHIPERYHFPKYDIALLKLDSPVRFNARVNPVCLPTKDTTKSNVVEGNRGVVTGWGEDENRNLLQLLTQAIFPIIPTADCQKKIKEAGFTVQLGNDMYCAGFGNGHSPNACAGDSGGPMVFKDYSMGAPRWVLEGIVSFSTKFSCAQEDQYTGFTLVSEYLDWINTFF